MSSAANPARRTTLLLAEEQPGSRDLIDLVLSKLGYAIVHARNFREAVSRLREHECACVLLSSSLPGCDGAEAVRQLRTGSGRDDAPVVFVLGSEQKHRKAWLDAGVQAYLVRPVEIERLLRLLKHSGLPRASADRFQEPSEPIIDLDHLFGFTDGDLQLERELAALYLSSADVYLQRMADALRAGEPWQAVVHALKGASSNLGARRVASLARAAEHADPSRSLLTAVTDAVDEVRRFFEGRQATR